MKLGSLFDGIGGFPLAGSRYGFTPVWASEIEPFPIEVTKVRFPNMKHLGDVTKTKGAEIEPVNVITFGSPCTRLSVAGRHDGFDITFFCEGSKEKTHKEYTNKIRATDKYKYIYTEICPVCGKELTSTNESALFFHAIRIIQEMRDTYAGSNEPIRPRFAVWENVPGAFSSNKGEDFKAVIEEICRVKESTLSIPMPAKGKWNKSGFIMGDGWSIAWRIFDAQFWGVPQRRRRIFLVADFDGQSAGEILFKRKGLSRYLKESGKEREGTAANVNRCSDDTSTLMIEMTSTKNTVINNDICPTLTARMGTGGNQVNAVTTYQKVTGPLMANSHPGSYCGQDAYTDMFVTQTYPEDVAHCLSKQPQLRHREDMDNLVVSGLDVRNLKENGDVSGTLQAKKTGGYSLNYTHPVRQQYTVRRLTPLECERLQGYPDGWTDIDNKKCSDSARYKALGNSVAIPCVEYVLEGIAIELHKSDSEKVI